jgi:uncharacterized protein (TIGR02271 family)
LGNELHINNYTSIESISNQARSLFMATSKSSLTDYPGLTEGMTVYGSDGGKLGKIVSMAEDHFIVEKGMFFPRDFTLRYGDIQEMRDGNVHLNLNKSNLEEWKDESYAGWSQVDDINTGRYSAQPKPEFQDRYGSFSTEETKVPLMEEKLDAQKTVHQAGEVTIRKVVHTELRHFTVPVMREEVRIERTPVSETEASSKVEGEAAFQESTIKVPIMQEEVVVSKRPVVKEEVRISKQRRAENREISEEVKKEEVDIEEQGQIRRKKAA